MTGPEARSSERATGTVPESGSETSPGPFAGAWRRRWEKRLARGAAFAATKPAFAAGTIALFLVAVAVRLPGAMESESMIDGLNDSLFYYRQAQLYAHGEILPLWYHGSGWSFLVAVVLKVWGAGSPEPVMGTSPWGWDFEADYVLDYAPGVNERLLYLTSALVAAALVPAIVALGAEVAGRRAGLAAGVVATFEPWLVDEAPLGLSEPLYSLLLVLAAVAGLRARRDVRWLPALGALAALAHVVRPNGIVAFAVLLAWAALLVPAPGVARVRGLVRALGAFAALTVPYLAWRALHLPSALFYGPNTRYFADNLWNWEDPFYKSDFELKETIADFFREHDVGFAADRLYRSLANQVVDTFGAGSGHLADPNGAAFSTFVTAFAIAALYLEGRRRELWIGPLLLVSTWATYAWMYPVLHWYDPTHDAWVRSVRYFSPALPFAIVLAVRGLSALAQRTRHPWVWSALPLGLYAFVYAPDALWAIPQGLAAVAEDPRFASLALASSTLVVATVLATLGGETLRGFGRAARRAARAVVRA